MLTDTRAATINLSPEQLSRYSKQMSLPGMSQEAQARLLSGSVAILGVDSSAARAAEYLSEVGLGRLVLVDGDSQRLHSLTKAISAGTSKSPDTRVEAITWEFTSREAEEILRHCHVVIDGLANWQHKLTASDICMQIGKSLVHAGGSGFRFQVYAMVPGKSACLRCVFPEVGIDEVPLMAQDSASLAPVSAMIGAVQAAEAVKLVAHLGATQGNELWKFDWLSGEFETIRGLDPRFDCPDCGRYARN